MTTLYLRKALEDSDSRDPLQGAMLTNDIELTDKAIVLDALECAAAVREDGKFLCALSSYSIATRSLTFAMECPRETGMRAMNGIAEALSRPFALRIMPHVHSAVKNEFKILNVEPEEVSVRRGQSRYIDAFEHKFLCSVVSVHGK